ncbi:hypothetical protein [Lutibacter sp.]
MSITSETFNILEENILTNFLSYTPEIYHSENEKPFPINFFNNTQLKSKVILMIKTGESKILNFENPDIISVFSKNEVLTENLFILIDAKNKLSEEQFVLLAEKYIQKIKLLADYTLAVIYNLKLDFKEKLPENILLGFEKQATFFNEHYLEFVKRFGIKDENEEISEIIEDKNSDTEIYNDYSTFAGFISHKESRLIEEIIVKNFNTEKGRTLRYILEYFITREVLILAYGDKFKLYIALKNSFNRDIGTYASIWSFKFDKRSNVNYIATKKKIKTLLGNMI